ncbi:ATP-binding protein [Hydrocarboniphaga effusa]|jgi:PAS domain S-box-containing protein
MPESWPLLLVGLTYLGLLFLLAYASETGWLPAWVARHPLTYSASLCLYATTWSFYGSVGFAAEQGYLFIAFYFGATLAFVLAPLLLKPLLRVVHEHQLGSIADLFAFRYPSRYTGVLVTAFMLLAVLPYLSLQIQAVVTSARLLTRATPPGVLALVFCGTITLFAVLFGARQVTPRIKHEGLVVAIAFESLVKIGALLAVGAYALWGVFGGIGPLTDWLGAHPEAVETLYAPLRNNQATGAWTTLLLVAFGAVFLLPRQFHMMFTENIDPGTLRTAIWAFPLLLLLINLPVPIILWASQLLQLEGPAEYYPLVLSVRGGDSWLTFVIFVGGLSAASSMIIVESLALAAMCLNHLVLPLLLSRRPATAPGLYRSLLWGRRALIAVVIFTGYVTYRSIEGNPGLVNLGLISFVAVTQFLPGAVAMLLWPRANRVGFVAGLCGGMLLWFLILVLPLLSGRPTPLLALPLVELRPWVFATFWSLAANVLLFVAGSFLVRPGDKERAADQALRLHAVLLVSDVPIASSVADIEGALSRLLGTATAAAELQRALQQTALSADERRPRQLHFLAERLQRNLSGLIGPQLAREALGLGIGRTRSGTRLVEEALEDSQGQLSGLAAELNHLRRFHRQILQTLPIGVCSLGERQEVQLWNDRMAALSGLTGAAVVGLRVPDLPAPWAQVFGDFLSGGQAYGYKLPVALADGQRQIRLRCEVVADDGDAHGLVLLVEDLTEQQRLEAELAHSARLASIGTLASGVAHEIGNPLTGITCVAQNLRDEPDEDERERGISDILVQSRRISDIVQSLLNFARAERPGAQERLVLRELLDEAIRLVRMSRSGRDLHFDNRVADRLEVDGDRGRMLQVFLNLLANAADASGSGGRVEVRSLVGAASVAIEIEDWGVGIPASLRDRILEPFFTTKAPGEGTGLGLSLVYRIVSDHGGSLSVDSIAGRGSRFTVRLPAHFDLSGNLLI